MAGDGLRDARARAPPRGCRPSRRPRCRGSAGSARTDTGSPSRYATAECTCGRQQRGRAVEVASGSRPPASPRLTYAGADHVRVVRDAGGIRRPCRISTPSGSGTSGSRVRQIIWGESANAPISAASAAARRSSSSPVSRIHTEKPRPRAAKNSCALAIDLVARVVSSDPVHAVVVRGEVRGAGEQQHAVLLEQRVRPLPAARPRG